MKKRIISLLLAIVLIVSTFSGCVGLDGLSLDALGYRRIYDANDLMVVAKNPAEKYILMADIDMDGKKWTPIENFSGVFDGNCHTISNLTITATAAGSENMGMFGSIAPEGIVKFLNIDNITINATETKALTIGAFAGVVEGTVQQCGAMGYIYDNREFDPSVVIGALIGRIETGASVQLTNAIASTDDAGTYTTTGLAADVALPVTYVQNNTPSLVGEYGEGVKTLTGFWRDRSYGSHRLSETMRARQKKAVDIVYAAGSVEWTTPYRLVHTSSGGTIHDQTFDPGAVYKGIPYDHTGGSLERMMHVLEEGEEGENGQIYSVQEWLAKDYGTSAWGGGNYNLNILGFTTYMGTDCSGGVAWGWFAISPVQVSDVDGVYHGGMFPYLTSAMNPSVLVQEQRGIYPVGEWTSDTYTPELAAYDVGNCTSPVAMCEYNGSEVMYEAYAQARKADCLLYGTPGGHIRMCSEDPVVIRSADGVIDPVKSYAITHEQGDGLYDRKYAGGNSSWRLNFRYTFKVLFSGSTLDDWYQRTLEQGSGPGYVPITIRALRDETVKEREIYLYPEGQKTQEIVSPVEGVFGSNYRIQAGRVIIKKGGKEVYNKTVFDAFEADQSLSRGAGKTYDLSHFHRDALEGLESGTYTFTVEALMADGEYVTIVKNQKFTI